jgi:hypothetical protein
MASSESRKETLRRYKETPRPAGVFRVRNNTSGRTLLGSSVDAPARINRERMQLKLGAHPNKRLQADWNALGEGAFELDVLDLLERREGDADEVADDLRVLEDLWRERLELTDERKY